MVRFNTSRGESFGSRVAHRKARGLDFTFGAARARGLAALHALLASILTLLCHSKESRTDQQRVGPIWSTSLRVDYFYLKISDCNGSITVPAKLSPDSMKTSQPIHDGFGANIDRSPKETIESPIFGRFYEQNFGKS